MAYMPTMVYNVVAIVGINVFIVSGAVQYLIVQLYDTWKNILFIFTITTTSTTPKYRVLILGRSSVVILLSSLTI